MSFGQSARSNYPVRSFRRPQLDAGISFTISFEPPIKRSTSPPARNAFQFFYSRLDQDLEAAIDQTFAVEWHRVDVGLNTRIGHHLFHAFVTDLL